MIRPMSHASLALSGAPRRFVPCAIGLAYSAPPCCQGSMARPNVPTCIEVLLPAMDTPSRSGKVGKSRAGVGIQQGDRSGMAPHREVEQSGRMLYHELRRLGREDVVGDMMPSEMTTVEAVDGRLLSGRDLARAVEE